MKNIYGFFIRKPTALALKMYSEPYVLGQMPPLVLIALLGQTGIDRLLGMNDIRAQIHAKMNAVVQIGVFIDSVKKPTLRI